MISQNKLRTLLMATGASVAIAASLAACGADDISSPGTGGNVTITYPPATSSSSSSTSSVTLVSPASGCPTIADPQGLTDAGTISGPTGTWRVCSLPSRINTSITLIKRPGLLYQLPGRVDVGTDGGFTKTAADTNVTLTIEPGVIIYGGTGISWLAVNRGNKINAVGTVSQPIVFTSRDNVLGLNTDTSQGQWGGVVLMGRAKITDCTTGSTTSGTCERQTEGAADPAVYGGADDTDNSGRMSYVQIRYSGYVLGANRELQSLTTEGTGSGTVLDHIMSFNSSDDGAEFFGGVVNMKHFVVIGADDDSLDLDVGATGNFQYGLLIQRPAKGDALFEIDSNGFETHLPRSTLKVSNFTAVQGQVSPDNEANDLAAGLFRGNSDTALYNTVIATPNNECIRMNGTGATPATLVARSVVLTCNATKFLGSGSFNAAAVATAFGSGANNNNDAFTSTLTNGFVNGANETAVPAFDVSALPGFSATTYIGAVKDSADTWYTGWTCNSATANLGSGNSACTSLPVN
ncbi:hypothetical protein [Asticcacaulis sp. AC402]|uniref:hypothetical protein n=1 Tax=Asticcacaulis sp. AC402 TaxID=1282361 RepID=UPI0003C3AC89|nr:hypothetical protein [Asticcacaulis sp. AC402]ESQ77442.1 hypothetical protein ABAC402_01180 [Asticcacaulis sp. AC402]